MSGVRKTVLLERGLSKEKEDYERESLKKKLNAGTGEEALEPKKRKRVIKVLRSL